MSKQKKEQQKKKKREQVRKARLKHFRETLKSETQDKSALAYISDLIHKKKDYETARGFLFQYVEKYPKHPKPYGVLATVCRTMKDYPGMFWASEKLLKVGRQTYEDYLLHYEACIINKTPATMLDCVEQMRHRFHAEIDDNATELKKDMLASFRSDAAITGDDLTLYSDDQLLELIQMHEKSLLYLSCQHYETAIAQCDQMIARFPFFRSAYNNKALAIMMDQGPDKAEPVLQLALEHHPDNLFIIAFKIHQLALLGRHQEMADFCERLAAVPMIFPNKHDFFTGKIEAFAWADDLPRILENHQAALQEMGEEWTFDQPACVKATHYAAVAHARLGNTDQAVALWESILKSPFAEDVVSENLQDVKNPVGERNGPWFFSYEYWLPRGFFTMLRETGVAAGLDDEDDPEEQRLIIQRRLVPFFKKAFAVFPSLESTLIEMLKRGGPDGRHWVRMFICQHQTPMFIQAILDFAMGADGSDECRGGFIEELSRAKLLGNGPIRIYRDGKVIEHRFSGFEIHWEQREIQPPISPQSQQKINKGNEAAQNGDFQKALGLFIEVNDKEPGRPSILYNIASFFQALGNDEVYEKTIDLLIQRFPDYFFVKIAQAKRLIYQRDFDKAWEILTPLHNTERMHGSEFKALSGTLVMYHLAKGEVEAAQSVHQTGVQVCGEQFPPMQIFQSELERKK